ncbi:GreA/GreB family elongation factor [Deinococcus soli (ex Cha et al. 2016)]|uniref:Transcription elongation factor GreA n=2 Tax=Deinococcus soli (ex Cha et al. 2016) TaxID=1309411 RepID=A0AAE3XC94_9DEIO|nr:GreA/GreB family elongation factor [Deinococcus soli (ex Cha et al. 2016)]MDR6218258.1 transcription elongation factor GreA [Deinococcus soli (ex Cha et al. 2016)]MDR6328998.1 transcription elongation factor GreA [Deinococcus soli (ex Cha et al. 2016)]MDR6751271.1 transcription elongation factor GreA [Deinococcus soli (ex Cha et al. 2016)]
MKRPVDITPEGLVRLNAQLSAQHLKLEEAREAVRQALIAKDYEDLSLVEAQQHLHEVELRIEDLEDTISRAVIIDGPAVLDRAVLGSVATLRGPNGQELRVQLVGSVEAGDRSGGLVKVSTDSPVGSALLGRQVGEQFSAQVGKVPVTYELLRLDA